LADENGILEQVRSGAPVEFEIDGHKFAIRQMTPTERDRLNYVEVKLRDKIMADYRADGLDKQPVSDELQ
jgi:chemotaxis regulatin CheY-phosphate phosphatase CheZ